MFSKQVKIGAWFLAGALASTDGIAHADDINTSGVICQNFNAAEALDIDYFLNAVRDINAAPRPVICSVPRSPPTVVPTFYVDGQDNAGNCTPCVFTLYDRFGTIVAMQAFTNCAPATGPITWNQLVAFPISPTGSGVVFDYASLLCTLPGSGNGLLYGVRAIQ